MNYRITKFMNHRIIKLMNYRIIKLMNYLNPLVYGSPPENPAGGQEG